MADGGFAICALISFRLLTFALRKLEVGPAYAVWTGVGAAGTALVGIAMLGESVSVMKLVSIGLILAGSSGSTGRHDTTVTLEHSTAAAGLDCAAVRARVEAGQVNASPPAPGRTVS